MPSASSFYLALPLPSHVFLGLELTLGHDLAKLQDQRNNIRETASTMNRSWEVAQVRQGERL